jgi:hypothetical protein
VAVVFHSVAQGPVLQLLHLAVVVFHSVAQGAVLQRLHRLVSLSVVPPLHQRQHPIRKLLHPPRLGLALVQLLLPQIHPVDRVMGRLLLHQVSER